MDPGEAFRPDRGRLPGRKGLVAHFLTEPAQPAPIQGKAARRA